MSKQVHVPWFVRGDIDGFFGLALDNLIQLLVIGALTTGVLGFSASLVYGRILPGAAISIVVGNCFYAWQAKRLSARTSRTDVTALPYGINTVSLFAFVFLVMLPAKLAAQAAGAGPEEAARIAWRTGLVACFGSALIETFGAFIAGWIRRVSPRAALLSTLAGIAVSFIALGFFYRTYAHPLVGLVTLAIVLACYFGRVRFVGGLPGGLVAVSLGTVLCWLTGLAGGTESSWNAAWAAAGWYPPEPALGDLLAALHDPQVLSYLSVIVPMGIVNVIGSLQNIESAAAAGDAFETRPSLLVNGLGSLTAAFFGSCFPTTLYIGHPGWKELGARIGYSVLDAVFVAAICMTGTVALIELIVPIEAGMAIVLWIGVVMVAQAFQATPRRHAPAVAMGLLPGIAAWGAFMLKQGLRAAGTGAPGGPTFGPPVADAIDSLDIAAHGLFALEQGFLFTAMILSAATVEIIERRFERAALWMVAAAGFSWVGLMHAYVWTAGDTAVALGWGTGAAWAVGYLVTALVLLSMRWVTRRSEDP